MKKLAFILIAYLTCLQTAQAATTALAESLREYEAITDFIGAPGFTVIGPDEFIVDIARLTRRIDILGTVEYKICTQRVTGPIAELNNNSDEERPRHAEYLATILVTPNPGIGPNIVTVLSIEPCEK